jgi:hypothetical protein
MSVERLSLEQARFAAEHLCRPGETTAVREAASMWQGPDHDRARTEAWEGLLARRFAIFVSLVDFDHMPVGWHRAAVRLFDERAAEALRAVAGRRDWPGAEEAERALLAAAPK